MAFKKSESSGKGTVPFFDKWSKTISEEYATFLVGKIVSPIFVKSVNSGKGFILNFDHEFSYFIWKHSSVGEVIKTYIQDEQGFQILIMFDFSDKGLSIDIGFDDEVEVAISEDKFDEGIYYFEVTNSVLTPIAPEENRKLLSQIPKLTPNPPVVFTTTTQPKPKVNRRSNGDGSK